MKKIIMLFIYLFFFHVVLAKDVYNISGNVTLPDENIPNPNFKDDRNIPEPPPYTFPDVIKEEQKQENSSYISNNIWIALLITTNIISIFSTFIIIRCW